MEVKGDEKTALRMSPPPSFLSLTRTFPHSDQYRVVQIIFVKWGKFEQIWNIQKIPPNRIMHIKLGDNFPDECRQIPISKQHTFVFGLSILQDK